MPEVERCALDAEERLMVEELIARLRAEQEIGRDKVVLFGRDA